MHVIARVAIGTSSACWGVSNTCLWRQWRNKPDRARAQQPLTLAFLHSQEASQHLRTFADVSW